MAEHSPVRRPVRGAGHETREIELRPMLRILGALLALLAVSAMGAWWLVSASLPSGYPHTAPARPSAVMEPPLQAMPRQDLMKLRAKENRLLHGMDFDSDKGIGRIPIERAMALLVKRSREAKGKQP